MSRQATSWFTPEASSASATTGPMISPAAWEEKTRETSSPRRWRLAYSLAITALTG